MKELSLGSSWSREWHMLNKVKKIHMFSVGFFYNIDM